jgi:IS5 family transposase
MVKYESTRQLSILEFKTPFQTSLRTDNKWVMLSNIVPWDRFASLYMNAMDKQMGRPGLSPRLVLGALIIKHMKKLDDRGTIEEIQENPYMQFFVGLKEFTTEPVFDPSLFVEIRKRIGKEMFDKLNEMIIESVSSKSDEKHNKKSQDKDDPPKNKGKLQIDATVADQYIKYPTDTDLLNISRKKLEEMIDQLYDLKDKRGVKPRTYRRKIDKAFAVYSKGRNKSKNGIRKMKRKLLECVNRNINHVNQMLDGYGDGAFFPLSKNYQRFLWIINNVYDQQKQMYDTQDNTCQHRIVSIFQPHVRPIKRGKQGRDTEFGSKLGVSLDNGFVRLNNLSWDAYNESSDLIKQVETYKDLHGHYPELVQADNIYPTRENRKYLKERNIRITAPPLGRKPIENKTNYYQRKKRKREAMERNQIEGKFGQGKNGYELNRIRARLRSTSESWISCIFFIMNLIKLEKEFFLAFFKSILLCIHGTQKTKKIYFLPDYVFGGRKLIYV